MENGGPARCPALAPVGRGWRAAPGEGVSVRDQKLVRPQHIKDDFENPFDVRQNVAIPEAQDDKARCLQRPRPPVVVCGLFSMLRTIQFDYQPCGDAGEVCDISFERNLPPKLESFEFAIAQA